MTTQTVRDTETTGILHYTDHHGRPATQTVYRPTTWTRYHDGQPYTVAAGYRAVATRSGSKVHLSSCFVDERRDGTPALYTGNTAFCNGRSMDVFSTSARPNCEKCVERLPALNTEGNPDMPTKTAPAPAPVKPAKTARKPKATPAPAPAPDARQCAGLPTRGVPAHAATTADFTADKKQKDGLNRVCRSCSARYTVLRKAETDAANEALAEDRMARLAQYPPLTAEEQAINEDAPAVINPDGSPTEATLAAFGK